MKKTFQNILISLLYFTPIGYLLKLISLNTGKTTPGVFVKMTRHEPVTVVVIKNATISDRVHWFINGTLLLTQAFYVVNYQIGGDFGGAYTYTALIFGIVNIISAFFPTIDWKDKKSNFLLLIIIISSLFFVAAFIDLKIYFLK